LSSSFTSFITCITDRARQRQQSIESEGRIHQKRPLEWPFSPGSASKARAGTTQRRATFRFPELEGHDETAEGSQGTYPDSIRRYLARRQFTARPQHKERDEGGLAYLLDVLAASLWIRKKERQQTM
jgi:hypothetical protein